MLELYIFLGIIYRTAYREISRISDFKSFVEIDCTCNQDIFKIRYILTWMNCMTGYQKH